MKNSVPQRAPDLLMNPVGEGYAYAVNCSYPHSFRLLNSRQAEILQAVNGRDDVQTMAWRLEIPCDKLEQFLSLLAATEIISFSGFTVPRKPAAPESLNF